jgi:hypothetical protein
MAKPGSTTAWLASSAAGLDSWSGVGPVTIRLALLCYMTPRIGVVIDDDADDGMEYGVLLPAFTRLLSIPNMHIYMQSYFSKFQYNIIINLSIHNFLKTISHFFGVAMDRLPPTLSLPLSQSGGFLSLYRLQTHKF